jgi:hypothetical protein
LRWFAVGALITAFGISGGSIVIERNRREAEQQKAEHARLEREHSELVRRNAELAEESRKLQQVVERLNVERRVALIDVVQQHSDAAGRVVQTVIRFTETDRDGKLLQPLVFGVAGEVPHFDALVLKFEQDFVAQGDALRGHSLALFRRVYGESQSPDSGYWLGGQGQVPDVYRVNPKPSEFELRLWQNFWGYASDPEKARGAGVRVAQGEAVYAPMRMGEHWTLTLEADGGLNLTKQDGSSGPTLAQPGTGKAPLEGESAPEAVDGQRLSAPSPLEGSNSG